MDGRKNTKEGIDGVNMEREGGRGRRGRRGGRRRGRRRGGGRERKISGCINTIINSINTI